jgi:hypothetical protein
MLQSPRHPLRRVYSYDNTSAILGIRGYRKYTDIHGNRHIPGGKHLKREDKDKSRRPDRNCALCSSHPGTPTVPSELTQRAGPSNSHVITNTYEEGKITSAVPKKIKDARSNDIVLVIKVTIHKLHQTLYRSLLLSRCSGSICTYRTALSMTSGRVDCFALCFGTSRSAWPCYSWSGFRQN